LANDTKLSTSDIITLAAGAVMLIAGFLAYWKFPGFSSVRFDPTTGRVVSGGGSEITKNVFGDYAFPLATFVWLFGILAAAHIALTKFANVDLPETVLDFTWNQIHLVLAVYCALVQVFLLITSDLPDKGIGFWLLTLGAIALVVGAVLRMQESPDGSGTQSPGSTF
jgi:hypothetical protein